MIEFAGRTIIPTTLDPIPPLFRTVPKHIAFNPREIESLKTEFAMPKGSALPVFKRLIDIAQRADDDEQTASAGKRRRKRMR